MVHRVPLWSRPPEGLTSLAVNDYVEAVVEILIVPQFASDYYGPNQNLSAVLTAHPNSWETVYRETTCNHLAVTVEGGSLERTLPVQIRTEDGEQVKFSITGGVGSVPVTIRGAKGYGPFLLKRKVGDQWETMDQSTSLGNDWWQSDPGPELNEVEITFTLPLDRPGDERRTQEFEWSLLKNQAGVGIDPAGYR